MLPRERGFETRAPESSRAFMLFLGKFFCGRGRVPPLVVEFSERAGGDVDVLRKPLILNPAGTELARDGDFVQQLCGCFRTGQISAIGAVSGADKNDGFVLLGCA